MFLDVSPFFLRVPFRKHLIHCERDVLMDCEPRQQGVVLKHHSAIRTGAGYDPAIQRRRAGVGFSRPEIRLIKVVLPAPE